MAEKTSMQQYLDTERDIKTLPQGESKSQLLRILGLVKQDLIKFNKWEDK